MKQRERERERERESISIMCYLYRKNDAYYDSLAAKTKAAAGGGDDTSDVSDADPGELLREMVRQHFEQLLYRTLSYNAMYECFSVGLY